MLSEENVTDLSAAFAGLTVTDTVWDPPSDRANVEALTVTPVTWTVSGVDGWSGVSGFLQAWKASAKKAAQMRRKNSFFISVNDYNSQSFTNITKYLHYLKINAPALLFRNKYCLAAAFEIGPQLSIIFIMRKIPTMLHTIPVFAG